MATIVLGFLLLASLGAGAWQLDRAEKRASKERQLLLERIQKPERVFVEQPTQVLDPWQGDAEEYAKLNAIVAED